MQHIHICTPLCLTDQIDSVHPFMFIYSVALYTESYLHSYLYNIYAVCTSLCALHSILLYRVSYFTQCFTLYSLQPLLYVPQCFILHGVLHSTYTVCIILCALDSILLYTVSYTTHIQYISLCALYSVLNYKVSNLHNDLLYTLSYGDIRNVASLYVIYTVSYFIQGLM